MIQQVRIQWFCNGAGGGAIHPREDTLRAYSHLSICDDKLDAFLRSNGLNTLPDSDTGTDSDSCPMQKLEAWIRVPVCAMWNVMHSTM